MCTLLWGKDTKKKTDKEEVVERVADEIPSELGVFVVCKFLPYISLAYGVRDGRFPVKNVLKSPFSARIILHAPGIYNK
eukprot:SAG11_NODE_198_length_12679_cov_7.778537_3_plen_79_part_00